jgi:AraC family transcriptional regulator
MSDPSMVTVASRGIPRSLDARSPRGPILNSADTSWAGLPFTVHHVASADELDEACWLDRDCGLLVILEGRLELVSCSAAGERRWVASSGSVDLLLGDQPRPLLRLSGEAKAVAIRFTQAWLRRLAAEGGSHDFTATETPFAPDDTVLELTRAMCSDVARNAAAGRVFAESVSLALLSYVAHRENPKSGGTRGNLSPEQCRRLRGHIIEHLGETLSLSELAAVVGLGSRHFSTLFRRAFALTPHQYVMRERLAEGARLLAIPPADIAAIALRVGFCSQSHFTAAFRAAYGVTPRRYVVDAYRGGVSHPDLR